MNNKGAMSDMAMVQPTEQPRTSTAGIEGVRIHASTSLLRMSAGMLYLASNGDWWWTMSCRSLKIQ